MAHVDLDNAYEWFPNRMVTSTQRWSSRWLLGGPSLFLCHLTAKSFNSRQPQRWRSRRLEIHADLEVGDFLGLQPPHGSAPLQSLVCSLQHNHVYIKGIAWISLTSRVCIWPLHIRWWSFLCENGGRLAMVEATSPFTINSAQDQNQPMGDELALHTILVHQTGILTLITGLLALFIAISF